MLISTKTEDSKASSRAERFFRKASHNWSLEMLPAGFAIDAAAVANDSNEHAKIPILDLANQPVVSHAIAP